MGGMCAFNSTERRAIREDQIAYLHKGGRDLWRVVINEFKINFQIVVNLLLDASAKIDSVVSIYNEIQMKNQYII